MNLESIRFFNTYFAIKEIDLPFNACARRINCFLHGTDKSYFFDKLSPQEADFFLTHIRLEFLEHMDDLSWVKELHPTIAALKALNQGQFSQHILNLEDFFAHYAQEYRLCKQTPDFLKDDKRYVLESIKLKPISIVWASDRLIGDRDLALEFFRSEDPNLEKKNFLEYFSNEMKRDKDVVMEAVKKNISCLNSADDELTSDRDFMLECARLTRSTLSFAHRDLFDDREFVQRVVKLHQGVFHEASERLKNDKQVVLDAVRYDGLSLKHVSETLQNDEEVVLTAIRENGRAFKFASSELKSKKEIVLEAVKKDGRAIGHVPDIFYEDKDIMLEAIRSFSFAMTSADMVIKHDRKFIYDALCVNPSCFSYIPPEFQYDEELIFRGQQNQYINMLSGEDPDLIKAYLFVESSFVEQHLKDEQIDVDFKRMMLEALQEKRCPSKIAQFIANYKHAGIRDFLLRMIGQSFFDQKIDRLNSQMSPASNSDVALYLTHLILSNLADKKQNLSEEIKPITVLNSSFLDANLKRYKKEFKDGVKAQALFQFLKSLESLACDPVEKLRIFKAPFEETQDVHKLIETFRYLSIYCDFFKKAPGLFTIDYLKCQIFEPLLDKELMSEGNQEAFFEKVFNSRHSSALLIHIYQHIHDPRMHAPLKMFINSLAAGEFENLRHASNAHRDVLGLGQAREWEKGAKIETTAQAIEEPFDIHGFLYKKIVTDNHGQNKLERLKSFLISEEKEGDFNPLEDALYELLTHDATSEKERIIERIEIEAQNPEYEGIEFQNDIGALKEALLSKAHREGETLVLEDSEDWQDLVFCGTEVHGSCQRLDGSPYLNKCLLGYVLDGKCRIITAKKVGDQKIFSRAIIKLLKDAHQRPALFLERIYPQDFEPIRSFAKERALKLGLPLYEGGDEAMLFSEGTASAYEYEDAGAGVTDGKYHVYAKKIC